MRCLHSTRPVCCYGLRLLILALVCLLAAPGLSAQTLLKGKVLRPAVAEGEAAQREPLTVVARGEGGAEAARATVDDSGAFTLALPSEAHRAVLDVEARFLRLEEGVRWRHGEPTEGLSLRCVEAGELVVRFSSSGVGLPRLPDLVGARLRLLGLPSSGSGFGLERVARIEAGSSQDPRPVARFGGLTPAQVYEFEAAIAPWIPFRADSLEIQVGVSKTVDMSLLLGASVRGRVVDERGVPMAGARVDAFSTGLRDLILDLPGADRPSGKDGTYEISGVPEGMLRLAPALDGYLGVARDVTAVEPGRVYEGVDLLVRDGKVLLARVSLPDGTPAPQAVVRWRQAGAWGVELESERALASDAQGLVRITGLVDRPVFLTVEYAREDLRDGQARRVVYKAALRATPQTEALTLRLAPTWSVRGHVVDDTGRLVQRFTVAWTRGDLDPALVQESDVRTKQVRSAEGNFEIEGLEEGPWRVWVLTRTLRGSEAPRVELPAYAGTMLVKLERRAKVGGLVRDAQGAPAGGVLVVARWSEPHVLGAAAFEVTESVRTSPEGKFEFDACGPGRVTLEAAATPTAQARTTVDTTVGGTHADLELRLSP